MHPRNSLAYRVYLMCAGQWRMAGDHFLEVDLLAVRAVLDEYGIRDPATRRACLEKCRALAARIAREWNERAARHRRSAHQGEHEPV